MKLPSFIAKYIRSIDRSWLIIGAATATLIVIISLVILWPGQSPQDAQKHYYFNQLARIKHSVQVIQSAQNYPADKTPITDQIQTYESGLSDGIAACRQMDVHYAEVKNQPPIAQIKASIQKTQKFCNDYVTVSDYAQRMSHAIGQFVEFPVSSLNSSGYASQLNNLSQILGYTQSDLNKLKSDPIADPAVSELLTLVDRLQKQLATTQAKSTPEALTSLAKTVKTQQDNMLNARTYYWNTTIQLVALSHAVNQLQTQFTLGKK